MNKLVYLHELDSVRNSPQEIKHARDALYEQIVQHGNCVVITFNQLADSKAFLGLAMASEESLAAIKSLMENGAIKISRFNDKRTASQYLQDNLCPTPAGCYGKFVLSGWGVTEELGKEKEQMVRGFIYKALRNSDPDYLDLLPADEEAGFATNGPERKRTLTQKNIQEIKRLVELMLYISQTSTAYVDVNNNAHPDYVQMLGFCEETIRGTGAKPSLDIIRTACTLVNESDAMKRSAYYQALNSLKGEHGPAVSLAEIEGAYRVFDICYNLVTEASIQNVSHHFLPSDQTSLMSEIKSRIDSYTDDYIAYGHTYNSNAPVVNDKPDVQRWLFAARIRKTSTALRVNATVRPSSNRTTYETDKEEQQDAWRWRVYKALGCNVSIMVLYALVLGLVEVVISLVQDMMVSLISHDSDTVGDLLSEQSSIAVVIIFIIGIIMSSTVKQNARLRWPLIGSLLALFFIILPILSCLNLEPSSSGFALRTDFDALPMKLLMGLPGLISSFIGIAIFAYVGWLMETKAELPDIVESATTAFDSLHDLTTFYFSKSNTKAEYINNATVSKNTEGSEMCTIGSDDWEKVLGSNKGNTIRPNPWQKYLQIVDKINDASANASELPIITDHADVLEFESSAAGRPIGIMYESPYSQMLIDLVENQNGERFAYERLVPKADGAVVIIPICDGKLVLLDQFRHAIRSHQLAFPRGFGEPGLSPEDNARKELFEELGIAQRKQGAMHALGIITPDSGISANKAYVFACEIPEPVIQQGYEEITDVVMITPEELNSMIAEGKITDGFTLSAVTLLRLRGGIWEATDISIVPCS